MVTKLNKPVFRSFPKLTLRSGFHGKPNFMLEKKPLTVNCRTKRIHDTLSGLVSRYSHAGTASSVNTPQVCRLNFEGCDIEGCIRTVTRMILSKAVENGTLSALEMCDCQLKCCVVKCCGLRYGDM